MWIKLEFTHFCRSIRFEMTRYVTYRIIKNLITFEPTSKKEESLNNTSVEFYKLIFILEIRGIIVEQL